MYAEGAVAFSSVVSKFHCKLSCRVAVDVFCTFLCALLLVVGTDAVHLVSWFHVVLFLYQFNCHCCIVNCYISVAFTCNGLYVT